MNKILTRKEFGEIFRSQESELTNIGHYLNLVFVILLICNYTGSSAGVGIGYGTEDTEKNCSVLDGKRNLFLRRAQTGSGNHQTSYLMGIVGSLPGVKWQGCEADHSCNTSKNVKSVWM